MLEEYKGYIQGTPVCSWKNGWKITSWPTASTKFAQNIMQYRTFKALIHIWSKPEMGKTHYFCICNLLAVMYWQHSIRWPHCQSGSWEQPHVHPRAVSPLVTITRPGPDDQPIHGLTICPSLGPSLSPGRGPMSGAEATPVSPSIPAPGWGVRWALAARSCLDVGSPWCSQTPGSPQSLWCPGVIMYSPFQRLSKI